jgi:hypothetical protein
MLHSAAYAFVCQQTLVVMARRRLPVRHLGRHAPLRPRPRHRRHHPPRLAIHGVSRHFTPAPEVGGLVTGVGIFAMHFIALKAWHIQGSFESNAYGMATTFVLGLGLSALAVNLSPVQFGREDLAGMIHGILLETDCRRRALKSRSRNRPSCRIKAGACTSCAS